MGRNKIYLLKSIGFYKKNCEIFCRMPPIFTILLQKKVANFILLKITKNQ